MAERRRTGAGRRSLETTGGNCLVRGSSGCSSGVKRLPAAIVESRYSLLASSAYHLVHHSKLYIAPLLVITDLSWTNKLVYTRLHKRKSASGHGLIWICGQFKG